MRMGRPPVPADVRFFPRLVESGDCWLWTGTTDRAGYGTFYDGTRRIKCHRWSYEFFRDEIPDGLQIDHLCRNTSCVNPWHMEPVTAQINTLRGSGPSGRNARKTHCPQGHPYDYVNGVGTPGRGCRTCRRAIDARCKAKRRTAA